MISICTTNYNCAHVLEEHLASVYSQLRESEFEYIVVDNHSRDRSLEVLQSWAKSHTNLVVRSRRCSMGAGRQLAFLESSAPYIVVLDTDVAYTPLLDRFIRTYLDQRSTDAVQAIYCGIFPRELWTAVGGRRDLNTHEDVDMWIRLWRLGRMKWYPVAMGENRKESAAFAGSDFLSSRYSRADRVVRRIRHELDLWKTREVARVDLRGIADANVVDFGLAPLGRPWFASRARLGTVTRAAVLARDVRTILRGDAGGN